MTTIKFNVTSESSGTIYELEAEPMATGLRFTCSCPAGSMGQFCKHRQAIIDGVYPTHPQPADADINTLKSWLATSRVRHMLDSISKAEESVKLAKKQLTMIKHELGRRMQDGTA